MNTPQTEQTMKRFRFEKTKDIQLNVRISKEVNNSIDIIANREGVERTEIVRKLIEVGLEEFWKENS